MTPIIIVHFASKVEGETWFKTLSDPMTLKRLKIGLHTRGDDGMGGSWVAIVPTGTYCCVADMEELSVWISLDIAEMQVESFPTTRNKVDVDRYLGTACIPKFVTIIDPYQ